MNLYLCSHNSYSPESSPEIETCHNVALLKAQIAKLTAPDGDEEALIELLELVKGGT